MANADNDENMSNEEAIRVNEEQTASASENADKAGKDWKDGDDEAPAPL